MRLHVGETLIASSAEISDGDGLTNASYAWQWIANDGTSDADIADATGRTYTLTAAEAGKTIKVRVTFTDDGGTEETLISGATAAVPVNNAPTGLPEISGTAHVGETLTVSPVGISDADGLANATYVWQWIANDGTSDADIAGATGANYTLMAAEAGKTIKVRVTFHRRRRHRGDADQRCDGGSGGEQCADGPSRDFRYGARRRDADGVACRYFGCGRSHQCHLRLAVDRERRDVGCRHRGRDWCELHADGRRGGQDDQGTGDVHRRRRHPRRR